MNKYLCTALRSRTTPLTLTALLAGGIALAGTAAPAYADSKGCLRGLGDAQSANNTAVFFDQRPSPDTLNAGLQNGQPAALLVTAQTVDCLGQPLAVTHEYNVNTYINQARLAVS